MVNKPRAVQEVEAHADESLERAWSKLETDAASVTPEDYPFIVEASRAGRARWLIKQRSKGKDSV